MRELVKVSYSSSDYFVRLLSSLGVIESPIGRVTIITHANTRQNKTLFNNVPFTKKHLYLSLPCLLPRKQHLHRNKTSPIQKHSFITSPTQKQKQILRFVLHIFTSKPKNTLHRVRDTLTIQFTDLSSFTHNEVYFVEI